MQFDKTITLGGEVRRKRKSLRLTLEETALVSGVSMSFLRSLEGGKETCQLAPVFKVLAALGLSLHVDGVAPDEGQPLRGKARAPRKEPP